MGEPRQITLRNVSPELARRLKSVSQERGESLNSTILHLLALSVGIDERRRRFERYATWSDEDLEEFDAAQREQRVIDDGLWE